MKLVSLELKNYRRHARTVIEWPDGVIAVLGRNGSGKSTILESIGFALFGVPATRTGKDLLRWDGAGPMDHVGVALQFELGGQAIRLHRELRGKALTPSATLTIDGKVAVDPGAGSNEAVTQAVEGLLGMDRDTFFTTLVAQQGDLDRLAEMTPAKRKQLLLEMLGIDALDRAIERAREQRRHLEAKVEVLRDALPDPDKLEADEASAKQAIAEADNDHRIATDAWSRSRTALEQAAAAWADQQRAMAAHEAAQRELDAVRKDRARCEAALGTLNARHEELKRTGARLAEISLVADGYEAAQAAMDRARQQARDRVRRQELETQIERDRDALAELEANAPPAPEANGLDERRAALQQRRAIVAATIQGHTEHLDNLYRLGDAADCPTCARPLSEHLPALRTRLESERTAAEAEAQQLDADAKALDAAAAQAAAHAEHQSRVERARRRIADKESALPSVAPPTDDEADIRARWNAARDAHEERIRLQARLDSARTLDAERTAAQAERDALIQQEADRQQALDDAPAPGAAHDAARNAHDEAAVAERDAERRVLAAASARDLAKQALEHAQRRRKEAAEATKRLRDAEEETRYWTAVAAGRGKGLLEAFKAHLVGRIGPAIGREASRLMERFTGGRYTEITLDSEYNVFVTDGGTRYTLDRFSGGESDLVHLALRLAVSRLLVERNDAEMRFLALDEVFGGLDDERRRLVLGALQQLGNLYSQVLLVTHHDTLRDALDAALVVENVDGEAKVALHAG